MIKIDQAQEIDIEAEIMAALAEKITNEMNKEILARLHKVHTIPKMP